MNLTTPRAVARETGKALAAAAGVAALLISRGLLHGTAEAVAELIISAATVAGVYRVPGPTRARVAAADQAVAAVPSRTVAAVCRTSGCQYR